MGAIDLGLPGLAAAYALLILPLALMAWLRIRLIGPTLVAAARMTLQLLFVGLYLQVVFRLNHPGLTALWLAVMIGVADVSIIRSCHLPLRRLAAPVFVSLLVGTSIPLLFFLGPLLRLPGLMDAQYVIPIGGMILGNCLRGEVIGLSHFYQAVRKDVAAFELALAQGAGLDEALRPFVRDACHAALAPTIASMATIGLVALPGMMTGVILGGGSPMTAIKYQIAIMIAIFCGTSVTVVLAIQLTVRRRFSPLGVLGQP